MRPGFSGLLRGHRVGDLELITVRHRNVRAEQCRRPQRAGRTGDRAVAGDEHTFDRAAAGDVKRRRRGIRGGLRGCRLATPRHAVRLRIAGELRPARVTGHGVRSRQRGEARQRDQAHEPTVVRDLRAAVEHHIQDVVLAHVHDVVERVVPSNQTATTEMVHRNWIAEAQHIAGITLTRQVGDKLLRQIELVH